MPKLLAFFAIFVCIFTAALADTIVLKTGMVEGKILSRTADQLLVETAAGRVTIRLADVVSIKEGKTPRESYLAMAARVKEADLLGHQALADFCKQNNLNKEAHEEFQKVLKLDPENEAARAALGYVKHDDKWILEDDLHRSEGLVKYRGRWVPPEEAEQLQRDEAQALWSDKLKSLAADVARGSSSAKAQIQKLNDPNAVPGLCSLLRHNNPAVRLAAIQALAAIPGLDSASALVATSIEDSSESVRLAAAKALAVRPPEALALYSASLRFYVAKRLITPADARQTKLLLEQMARSIGALGVPLAVPLLIRMLHVQLNLVNDSGDISPQAYIVNLAAGEELKKLTGQNYLDQRQRWLAWWVDHRQQLVGDALAEQIDPVR